MDGIVQQAELTHISDAAHATFRFASRDSVRIEDPTDEVVEESVPIRQLICWGGWKAWGPKQSIWLKYGSWLYGDVTLENNYLSLQSDWLDIPRIQIEQVRGIVFLPPASQSQAIELRADMAQATGDRDVVWLTRGRRISGIVNLDTSVDGNKSIAVNVGKKTIQMEMDQIRAIVFSPDFIGPLVEIPDTTTIALEDGSLMNLTRMQLRAQHIQCDLATGISVHSLDRYSDFHKTVTYIANKPSSVLFLADQTPAQYQYMGKSHIPWPLGLNEDVFSRPLAANPKGTVGRGIALHSHSQVAYRWDATPATFHSEVVLAPPRDRSSKIKPIANCKILVARGGKIEIENEFQFVGHTGKSVSVSTDLEGASLFALVVEPADSREYGDHVLWLEARIVADDSNTHLRRKQE